MKKICFVAVLLFSNVVLTSDLQPQIVLQDPTSLVGSVLKFLNQFQVASAYKESKEDFLKRIKAEKKFDHVSYAAYSEKLFKKDKSLKVDDGKKRHIIGLFIPAIAASKSCGFWGGCENGFYVSSTTKIIGRSAAKLEEKGFCEWIIRCKEELSGTEFEGTPIQPLLAYILAQKESEVVIPLPSSGNFVAFTKEVKEASGPDFITARLRYGSSQLSLCSEFVL